MASLAEILHSRYTARVVRREAATTNRLLQVFGFQPDGGGELRVGGRKFGYDIFNDARTVAFGAAPGRGAATATRQPVGRVDGVFPRMNEVLNLPAEELHNYRVLGGPVDSRDEAGKDYAQKQQRVLGQRAANFRLALLAGMIRDGLLYGHQSGDSIYYDFSSTSAFQTLNWRMPSGNRNQLDMLGDGAIIGASWATASTNIVLDLLQIDAALQELTGTRLELIICSHTVWNYIITNDVVQEAGGSYNSPFSVFERQTGIGSNGLPLTSKIGNIRAVPFIDFLITDEGLKVGAPGSEAYEPFIEPDHFWFGPKPDTDFFQMCLGSEPVSEGHGKPKEVKYGLHAWTKELDNPTVTQMFTLDNCIPANYVPNCNGYADCTP